MHDDEFEWDDLKAKGNLRKHGISFEDARLVFYDVFSIERPDDNSKYEEDRTIVVGMARDCLLTVVYTERDERTRIISARRATRRERDDYYQDQTSE
jgi:uncharacterized DUF497 family protein